jgi:hypothetical protein
LRLVLFGFDLYDRDCSNVLEATEIAKMLHDLYGKNFEKNKRALKSVALSVSLSLLLSLSLLTSLSLSLSLALIFTLFSRLYHDIEHGQHQTFTPHDFREFAKNHPALFFPAFEMQRLIQTKILGPMFWKRHAEKRLLASSDGIVRVRDLIGFRTKVNNPAGELRHLHPIFQNYGLPSVNHYSKHPGDGKHSAPSPTHRQTAAASSSATESVSNVSADILDEPTKQFHQHQSHLQSVLEITDIRGHRASKAKHVRETKPLDQLTPLQREQIKYTPTLLSPSLSVYVCLFYSLLSGKRGWII